MIVLVNNEKDIIIPDYNDLDNKPSINGVVLEGNKTAAELGIDIDTTNFYTKGQADDRFQLKGNYLTSIPAEYITETELNSKDFATNSDVNDEIGKLDSALSGEISKKQNALVSGENIKTINGESILGDGNIEISGGESVDLSDYYTKGEVDNLIDNVEVDLSGYATEQWVEEKDYLQIQPNNEIWYTSRLGEVISPVEENFDANIVSNTYENGKGVIVFDKDITVVGSNVFADTAITSIDIPNSVTSIGERAFGYSTLTNITIPNSVTSIGDGAFNNCLLLHSIDIPNSVISIGERAFESCNEMVNVSIGSSVTSIGEGAFYECEKIENITIPNSVTSIGYSAFEYCSNLQNVYCKSITPPVGGNNMFEYCSSELKIYVPINSVDAYKTAEYWSNYADSIIGCVFEDDIIVSGVNIKTINGKSILGSGNIEISGGTTDLSNYYTKTETDNKFQEKGDYLTSIPSEYVTETELNEAIAGLGGGGTTDLSNYYTKSEIDAQIGDINTILENIIG